MKNVCFLLLFLFFNLATFSKSVSYKTLEQIAVHAYQQRTSNAEDLYVKNSFPITEGNDTIMIIFSFSQPGFLVLSADDIASPILAYSNQNNLDMNNPAPGVLYWLNLYKQQILDARREGITATEDIQNQWNLLILNGAKTTTTTVVEPLITAKWNQDKYYNQLSPMDMDSPNGYDNKVPVGCVALAMSMIIYYYRYPAVGQGTHTNYSGYGTFTVNYGQQQYDFNAMQDQLTGYNYEVAKLIFHCATSVDMNYSPEGSGAYSHDVPYALKNYFKFSNNTTLLDRSSYSLSNWLSQIKTMLNGSKPIFYAGSSSEGGHAFVCDGYDSDDLCHFNFGWGGSGNGFFTVGNTTGSVGGYYSSQRMIINATPASFPNINNTTTFVNAISGTLEDGSSINHYANNMNVTYILAPANATQFSIQIQKLKTEIDTDTLSFWKGNPDQGELVGSYSGDLSDINLTIPTDSLYITFKSNDSITNQGWRISYRATITTTGCSLVQVFTGPSATFSDGTALGEPYAPFSDCNFLIRPTTAQNITLTFNRFDLSVDDMLEIYDITTTNKRLIDTYTGNTIPAPKTYPIKKIQVIFKTDNKNQKDGFEMTYQINAGMDDQNPNVLMIYPNPTTDRCMIKTDLSIETPLQGIVYNNFGKQVVAFTLESNEKELDIAHLPSGIYLIQLKNSHTIVTKKLIKN